ncbi:RNA polymerase sigma factor [Paradesulfitobacterium ferrireducens]|uniref:RNA polymerase sigma factor n=1 Tax=Paradesulfitobacterium ferrireducens TaxID=2816476 RepID=UPI001A8CBA3E|nr:sigma-70 family RNA polymerase sigma factor [Paradesulfitobacterium ferrireducens]
MPPLDQDSHSLEIFQILFEQSYGKLFRIAYAITGDRNQSKDVIQQAFLKAYSKIDQLKDKTKYVTWITSITVHEAHNIIRANKIRKVIPFSEVSHRRGHSFENEFLLKDEVTRVLNQLSQNDLEILTLRYFSELSLEEISQILNISKGTAKTRLHRARTNFREIFLRDNPEEVLGG